LWTPVARTHCGIETPPLDDAQRLERLKAQPAQQPLAESNDQDLGHAGPGAAAVATLLICLGRDFRPAVSMDEQYIGTRASVNTVKYATMEE
jgi:hypothetical protein